MSATTPQEDVAILNQQYNNDFEAVCRIIAHHRTRAMSTVHNESLCMIWEVGSFVHNKIEQAVWGDGVVRLLADFLRMRNPSAKGWSYRTITRW